ncbi:hypothetical protein KCP71_25660 [Salmonella enterica subsp. enterica]|nr:hypothetical protein KCP71_25660 [Salmonella enterica subsp. enterica]
MGKAILGGLIASGQVLPGQIWPTPLPDKVAALHDQYGINAAQKRAGGRSGRGYRFGAKPHYGEKCSVKSPPARNKDSLVVSIAAGVTLDQFARARTTVNHSRYAEYAVAGQRRNDLRHTQRAGHTGRYG